MKIYKKIKNNGIINFSDSLIHRVKYIVKDIDGNASTLEFKVKKGKEKKNLYEDKCVAVFDCMKENIFKRDNINIGFPAGTFYEDLKFDFSQSKDTVKGALSPTYTIHNSLVPVHSYYNLLIKTKPIEESLRSKVLIANIEGGGRKSEGGVWSDGYISGQTRSFGKFTVLIDTIAPNIKPLNITPGKKMGKLSKIHVGISDNLSGIKSYRASIDGRWILSEYDPRQSHLACELSKDLAPGKHEFKMEVTDNRENKAVYKVNFIK